jgi:hypothetical protein
MVSVSWGDHLVFGEGDGRLATPDAVQRRMAVWRGELGATAIHWRLLRSHLEGRFCAAKGRRHPTAIRARKITWNELEAVPRLAHEEGLKAYLYVTLFDEGWPLAPKKVREVSYHNRMHGQHVSWQSAFSRGHPEWVLIDRNGRERQWGVLCLGYPEVRRHFRTRFLGLLASHDFDGLFVCLRSQSRPPGYADQYGFNDIVRQDYRERYGRDIRTHDFDLGSWHDLLGDYLTAFLSELQRDLRRAGIPLAVGAARGDVLGPPLGNATLQWRRWLREDIIDELIINQNSSRCPSMWHDLWPMHRGYGYRQNYLDGHNLSSLKDQLRSDYGPVVSRRSASLYVARMWDERSEQEETELLGLEAVSGLVFSSFRHDNPGAIKRGDWTA